jgi:hypothetical protein
MTRFETLKQLVEKRKGYKYLNKDWTSPYQCYKYNSRQKIFKSDELDEDLSIDCGKGFNLATLGWILKDCRHLTDKLIVEYSIPPEAKIVVPTGSTGKFRTNIIHKKKSYSITDLVPEIKNILDDLKKYKPINPINAEKLPEKRKLKLILNKIKKTVGAQAWDQVSDQVGAQVRDQAWEQVREQVGYQVWEQVGDLVWAQVGDQVWDQVGDLVWAQVWEQVWAQVREQVGYQVRDLVWAQVWEQAYVAAYFAEKEFLKLDYEHPAFDLIRLGVFVIEVSGKLKVFGKNGKFLGEFKE